MQSKIALKVSEYFQLAYEMSQTNMAVKAFDSKRFAGVLEYHAKYFEASAWFVLGLHRFMKAKEEGEFMGRAAGTLKRSLDMYNQMGALLKVIDASYAGNYNKKIEQAKKMC